MRVQLVGRKVSARFEPGTESFPARVYGEVLSAGRRQGGHALVEVWMDAEGPGAAFTAAPDGGEILLDATISASVSFGRAKLSVRVLDCVAPAANGARPVQVVAEPKESAAAAK